MKKSELADRACSLARTLALLGDAWSILAVRELFLGTQRFEDFQAQMGASPSIVSDRLRRLVDAGLVRRRPYQAHPPRDEFHLTRMGVDFWPVVVALTEFGDRWLQRPDTAPPLALRHVPCGHVGRLAHVCAECGEPMNAANTHAEFGPALRRDRAKMRARFEA